MSAIALPLPQPVTALASSTSELSNHREGMLVHEAIAQGLLESGSVLPSPGNSFQYEIIGPVCRLYDLDQLPYPCCRLQWKGKEPSWNRQGRRFVPDLATRKHASYQVRLLGESSSLTNGEMEITLHWKPALSMQMIRWWSRNREAVNNTTRTGQWSTKTGLDRQPIQVWEPQKTEQQ